MPIMELPGIRSINRTDGTGSNCLPWLQDETKATSGPMAAHNNPLRRQNPDEAQAHLSTTRFHMQAAAPSSHRSRRVPDLPYQERARCGGGEITGSEQSVRQRATAHMTEERPLAHARMHARVNIAVPSAPRVNSRNRELLFSKGTDQSPRKGMLQPPRACTHATVNINRCGIGLHAADTAH